MAEEQQCQHTQEATRPQLIYLDPHTSCVQTISSFPDGQELQTYHQPQPLALDLENVDPGLSFSFYCRSPADLDDLWSLTTFRTKSRENPRST